MTHEIKILEDYIEPILKEEKTFEIRQNDRGYQKGDKIKFKPMQRGGLLTKYGTGIEYKTFEITYVHSGLGLKDGYVAFGIKEIKE